MKFVIFAVLICLVITGPHSLRAEEPAPAAAVPDTDVFIELQMVVVPQKSATPLIADFLDEKKSAGAWDRLQTLIGDGTAKLVGWPMLTTQSGRRATFEAVREIRYATQFNPAEISVYYPEKSNDGTDLTEQKGAVTGVEFNATPAYFEQRNAGVTFEVEPTISAGGKSVELNLVPQHVQLKAMKKMAITRQGQDARSEEVTTEQPEFDTMKSTMKFTLRDGERRLLSVFRTADPSDDLELFIIHAEVEHLK